MDDVNVNEYSDGTPIKLYNKFFKDKVYFYKTKEWCVSYKVSEMTLAYGGGYRVQCMILNLKYNLVNKISPSKMNLLRSYFRNGIKSDLGLFSMDNLDVVILNRNTFEIVEKQKPSQSKFKIYTGLDGFEKFKQSYDIFNEYNDEDDLLSFLRKDRF